MKQIKFLRPDDRIINQELHQFVGKKLWFPDYIADGLVTRALQSHPDALVNVEIEDIPIPRYSGQDLNGKTLLVARSGGAGDILMIAPSIMKIKKLYPKSTIIFVTDKKFEDVLRMMLTYVDKIGSWPIPEEMISRIDYYATFEKTIEAPRRDSRRMHGVDLFAKLFPAELSEDDPKIAELTISMRCKSAANMFLESIGVLTDQKYGVKRAPYAVVQFRSSGMKRSFDPQKMVEIIARLSSYMHVVIVGGIRPVIDKDGKIAMQKDCPVDFIAEESDGSRAKHPRIHNKCGEFEWPTTAALVQRADLVISADSALVHIAGSFGVPCIAFYGPFPKEIRTKYYENCYPIEAQAECAPCFAHGSKPCSHFDQEKMCSGCWESISVDQVMSKIEEVIGGKNGLEKISS